MAGSDAHQRINESTGIDVTTPVQYLKGVGPKKAAAFKTVGVETTLDLLYRVPRRYLDRSTTVPISQLTPDLPATVVGHVAATGILKGRKRRFEAILTDGTGQLSLLWFKGLRWVQKSLHKGVALSVSGRVGYYHGLQMVHPEFEILDDEEDRALLHTGRIIPLYPTSEELRSVFLDSRGVRKLVKSVVDNLAQADLEFYPEELRKEFHLPELVWSLRMIHFPDSTDHAAQARYRLAFDELFFMQLSLAFTKKAVKNRTKSGKVNPPSETTKSFYQALPFALTDAQKRVLKEISTDMQSQQPMYRLLQGDVGSGKTIVAVLAMVLAAESGRQAALMVPTEILAEQHGRTIGKLLEDVNVSAVVVTGSMPTRHKDEIWEQIERGEIDLIIGTHALFSRERRFNDLGLVIIDEQHRFGVSQRARLVRKGAQPDVLIMTATPIPRTLALTLYGDLDISIIDELPPQKGTITTVWRTEDAREKMYEYITASINDGRQIYIVYPLVDESEKMDLKAATAGYESLKERFPNHRVGLIHGRLKPDERQQVMNGFFEREIDILVSTTVIEVGVDAPDAGVMVIENAERFGLSQLHQLRGRIGRGPGKSVCVLMVGNQPSEIARARIEALCEHSDGFQIAEIDLELRGPGEFFGTRQHGLPEMHIAHPVQDTPLIPRARDAAQRIINKDPALNTKPYRRMRDEFKRRYGSRIPLFRIG